MNGERVWRNRQKETGVRPIGPLRVAPLPLGIEHASRAEQRSLAKQMSAVAPFNSDAFCRYDKESNPLRTTVYLAREGTEVLPGDERSVADLRRKGQRECV